jgi:hypothetical protein
MDTLHIGGVADGETSDLPENVMTGRHSFKLSRDFLSDPLHHHDYVRRVLTVRRDNGTVEVQEVMVWDKLSEAEVKALIEARLNVQIV